MQIVNSGFGNDKVIGFSKNIDKLVFKNVSGVDVGQSDITASDEAGELMLTTTASDTLIVAGVTVSEYDYDTFFV